MSESDAQDIQQTQGLPPSGADTPRPGFFEVVSSSIGYLRNSAQIEGSKLRGSDTPSVILLPASCLVLVLIAWSGASPSVLSGLFVLPLAAFFYYIGSRLGIVKSLTTRQAYLMWHILMATFLLGVTFAVFLVCLKDALLRI